MKYKLTVWRCAKAYVKIGDYAEVWIWLWDSLEWLGMALALILAWPFVRSHTRIMEERDVNRAEPIEPKQWKRVNIYMKHGSLISTEMFSIGRYWQDVSVNEAKKLLLPSIRGTWLPSFDRQCTGGLAINWLGVRVRYN